MFRATRLSIKSKTSRSSGIRCPPSKVRALSSPRERSPILPGSPVSRSKLSSWKTTNAPPLTTKTSISIISTSRSMAFWIEARVFSVSWPMAPLWPMTKGLCSIMVQLLIGKGAKGAANIGFSMVRFHWQAKNTIWNANGSKVLGLDLKLKDQGFQGGEFQRQGSLALFHPEHRPLIQLEYLGHGVFPILQLPGCDQLPGQGQLEGIVPFRFKIAYDHQFFRGRPTRIGQKPVVIARDMLLVVEVQVHVLPHQGFALPTEIQQVLIEVAQILQGLGELPTIKFFVVHPPLV